MNPDEFLIRVRVDFFLDGKRYAMQHTRYVPAVGDEVRFKGVVYKVTYRIFIYDEKDDRVSLSIEKVEE